MHAAVPELLPHAREPSAHEVRARRGPARERQLEWQRAVVTLRAQSAGTRWAGAVERSIGQGLVLLRSDGRADGLADRQLRALTARHDWCAPRRGVLCPMPRAEIPPGVHPAEHVRRPHGDADQIHAAAVALVRPGSVVSHESAAAMHGLPVLGRIERPTLSVVDALRVAGRDDALVRCVGMRPYEVTDWFGAPVTGVARTVVDIARCGGAAAGLVVADAALYAGLTTSKALALARHHARYRPGVRTFDRVLELACAEAESPLESLVRLCLIDGELPPPEPQQWVQTHLGRFRVDLLYRGQRVIVEADGELKYGPHQPDALIDEKRRQEALERAGFIVIRVSWREVRSQPFDVVDRVRRALAVR